ncbi:MAG: T9SS type A sorting domain-containing protein, partial [Fibrobacter sp.]|nr:T9SS type A sorting domain-containing protein [Fibrobacter sp.]
MEEDSDDAAQFAFNLGQVTGAVKISDVKLVFTTANPGSETDPSVAVGGGTDAIAVGAAVAKTDRIFQVFDMQGRMLGMVKQTAGTSLNDALMAKYEAGVYMLRQSNGRTFSVLAK